MKKDIHPKWYPNAKVICNGEVVMEVGSTQPELRVDVWSGNHPFYTGEQRIVDTAGQVERFMKRMEAASGKPSKRQVRLAARAEREAATRRVGDEQAEAEVDAELVASEAAAN